MKDNHTVTLSDLEIQIVRVDDCLYNKWVKRWPTALGDYVWGVTNLLTGTGKGGWAATANDADKAANEFITQDHAEAH